MLAYGKKYSFENKELKKAYRLRNKERFREWHRAYYQRNKQRLKERRYHQQELRVGAEASLIQGEIPVAAVASQPLNIAPQRRKINYEME